MLVFLRFLKRMKFNKKILLTFYILKLLSRAKSLQSCYLSKLHNNYQFEIFKTNEVYSIKVKISMNYSSLIDN